MTEKQFRELLLHGLDGIQRWESGWRAYEPHPSLTLSPGAAREAVDALVARLADNYPFFHPDYAGQMLRPPHSIALLAYALTARINPSNHALDGGPATAELERECIAQLAAMFNLASPYLGHLTSSGTAANLEALWVASRLRPGKAVAFSSEAHYTHKRMCDVLGIRSIELPVNAGGRLTCEALQAGSAQTEIGTVIVTAGTTATGAIDPIDDIVALARQRNWRVHADAAYGGFFATIAGLCRRTFRLHRGTRWRTAIQSWWILTSMACSPTVVAQCFLLIRTWARCTNMIRHTRISARTSCI